ncbi:MAG TPA: HNH endonuclease signature motif containing protein [Candidatus Binatia bacterium]
MQLDVELRVAARAEAAARRELGEAARPFLHGRAHHRLGFVRLSDYTRERLGVSARTLQVAARMAERLAVLPAIGTAFDRADISWTQARLLCAVATEADEQQWLELASRCCVEDLERRVRPGQTSAISPEPGTIDGEPMVRVRLRCPARVRALWRRALELASRVAGETLADWRAAEIIAAEGFSGRSRGRSWREHPGPFPAASADASADDPPREPRADTERPRAPAGGSPSGKTDPFALDARLVAAVAAVRTAEPRIGRLLRMMVDHRFYRTLGFQSVDTYVRERLGLSLRKAWALLKVEKATYRSGEFARAYAAGTLSWARALALLPVLDRDNAASWIARAGAVTVRRLADEVTWVLDARDVRGLDFPLDPPPLGSPLAPVTIDAIATPRCQEMSPAQSVQIGAHELERDLDARARAELCDVEITFVAPASVAALFRSVLDDFARPDAPRWVALERLLLHAARYWTSLPAHRDPVFARDGWRCAVPACTSRRNLHDHHIVFRSRGGGNARDNRVSVCAAHHLHGLHDGSVRAEGTAPDDVEWQLGTRAYGPPLLTSVGDRLLAAAAS